MNWLRLLYWLGPWCDQEKSPTGIETEILSVQQRFELWIYRPRKQSGVIFVIPGLHPEGPEDPRLDRFCRVLAGAGMLVGVPSLPTMQDVVMREQLIQDTKSSFAFFVEHTQVEKVGVFSISAASIAAFSLGVDPVLSQRISYLHSFGGFSSWADALSFAMTGKIEQTKEILDIDPLGLPVVFLNMMESFPDFLPQYREILAPLWKRFVEQTWEKPEMQEIARYRRVAEELARELEHEQRLLFLQGCSVVEGGVQRIEAFLKRGPRVLWLEPQNILSEISVPVYLSHGRDDVVVPYPQIEQLREWLPAQYRAGVFVTGFYHHTGVVGFQRLLQIIPSLPSEIIQSIRMVMAIARTGGILR